METKPYDIQSPEQIAKDYGGNKQKIAEAMQMGILDPTAGTLAGMFIDRMRSAAVQEAAPQQTVAQQTFAPPAPPQPPMGAPAGLGATPQAAAMPPMGAAPPQGMPPQGMPAPQGPPPQGMPAMAEGGMVPPYASGGGLSDLPVPDTMFDEPTNGGFDDGYAGGGLVAFAMGNEVEEEDPEDQYAAPPSRIGPNGEIIVDATVNKPAQMTYFPATPDFKTPQNISGYSGDLVSNLDRYTEAAPRKTERAEQFAKYLDQMMSPESQKARRKEDMWTALGQIGAKMATTPGSLLQAASAGIGEALPGIAANAKERRAEQRAVMKTLVDEERMGNKEITERADKALDMLAKYGTLADAMKQRSFQNLWENMGSADRRYVAQVNAAAGIQSQQISTAGNIEVGKMGLQERRGAFFADTLGSFKQNAATDPEYQRIVKTKGLNAGQRYLQNEAEKITNRVFGGGKAIQFDREGNPI
jgi:hypothetical protein